jgi:hypothetical protein
MMWFVLLRNFKITIRRSRISMKIKFVAHTCVVPSQSCPAQSSASTSATPMSSFYTVVGVVLIGEKHQGNLAFLP